MNVLLKSGRYDASKGAVLSYLLGTARHLMLKRLSHSRSFSMEEFTDDLNVERSIERETPLDDFARQETIEVVRAAVQSLPAAHREVIVLCELEEMDYVEAANVHAMSGRYGPFPIEPRQGTAQQKTRSDSGMTKLNAALRALDADDAKLCASAEVRERLLSKLREASRARRRKWLGVSSIAAALLLAIALYAWRIGNRQPAPETSITEVATEFLPLPYSHVPMHTVSTVRIEVPATALASFGLAPGDYRENNGTVQADVLVGEDGIARAVRFIRTIRN